MSEKIDKKRWFEPGSATAGIEPRIEPGSNRTQFLVRLDKNMSNIKNIPEMTFGSISPSKKWASTLLLGRTEPGFSIGGRLVRSG